jgi:hypothetical protein
MPDDEDELESYGSQDWEDFYDDWDGEFRDELDELEADIQNCGMLPDGTCMLAGSEECDWECPFGR